VTAKEPHLIPEHPAAERGVVTARRDAAEVSAEEARRNPRNSRDGVIADHTDFRGQ
jgi:hypothetical protein